MKALLLRAAALGGLVMILFVSLVSLADEGLTQAKYRPLTDGAREIQTRPVIGAPVGTMVLRFLVRVYGNRSCSGTVIHQNWVLTAAHCVDNLAVSDLGHATVRTPSRFYSVTRVILHPRYMVGVQNSVPDIALLEIEGRGIPGSDRSRIKILSEIEESKHVLPDRSWGTLIAGGGNYEGWGFNLAASPIQSAEECAKFARWGSVAVNEYAFCASGTDIAEDGDSGGPWTTLVDGETVQYGIHNLSRPGSGSDSGDYPMVMTRTSKIFNWVREYVSIPRAPRYTESLYFPVVAVGNGVTSDLVISNASGWDSGAAELQFFNNDGERVLLLSVGDSRFSLPSRGTVTFAVAEITNQDFNGSAVVLSENPLTAFARYRINGLGTAGIASMKPRQQWYVPYRSGSFRTGVAIRNSEEESVSVLLTIQDSADNRKGISVRIPGNGTVARFIDELFPEQFTNGQHLSGTLYIQTPLRDDERFVVGALELGPEEGDFSAVPLKPGP